MASLILVMACSFSTGTGATPDPIDANPPQQAVLPTYTPYPTYTPLAPQVEPETATATESASEPPKFDAILLQPGRTGSGSTKYASVLYYFKGRQGQSVSLVLIGEPRYQEFSLRDADNKGIKGCDVSGQTKCIILNYSLPGSGVFYVLVDRTYIDGYKKYPSCVTHAPYPDWCYRGGDYYLTIEIQ